MQFSDVPLPEIYRSSSDFRFFVKWFETCLTKIQYDTENVGDLLDPQRCPSNLLWMLAETMGFKYDDRVSVAFNRLILLYFMSMIYNRGSKTGMTLAAEVNLAQLSLNEYAKENPALEERLEDTSIPVNSVYVTPHVDAGYIDVVYFSEKLPIDSCIEYVRPLGMYCFQNSGLRADSRTKISVDARLTNEKNIGMSIGSTHVGHYRRADYASLQKTDPIKEKRNNVYYRNSDYEKNPRSELLNPGYRTLYSLQIANNDHIVRSLVPSAPGGDTDKIFSLGYGPQDVTVVYPDNYLKIDDRPEYNLRYDRDLEESFPDVYTVDSDRTASVTDPRPAVNPNCSAALGDAISISPTNDRYIVVKNGQPEVENK